MYHRDAQGLSTYFGGVRQMLTMADKGGRGGTQMLTIADEGG